MKQLILKYINEIIAIIILIGIVVGIILIYNNNITKENKSESCQELREDSIIKDQLIGAYKTKNKIQILLINNNEEIISNQETIIINLEIIVKDQERMLELREQQIKLLRG